MIGYEGILGISAVLSSDINATGNWIHTIIGGRVCMLPVRSFKKELADNRFLQMSFLEYLNSYIKQISQRVVCGNHHLIEERLSTWFLMLDDRCDKDGLRITHEQIAHFLGVHRPSITFIAQALRKKDIIEYSRGRIKILDRSRLEQLACECYKTAKY